MNLLASLASLSSEMVLQAQLDRPLRKLQDSTITSGVLSKLTAFAEDAVNQEPGGYIAIDNFHIVTAASKDINRNFTAS